MAGLQDLQDNVFGEILIKAASHDWREFYKLRGLCRGFRNVPNKYVWKRVSLDNYNHFEWGQGEKHAEWFHRCVEAENPEALLRKALEPFGMGADEVCLENLKFLKTQGYLPAICAYGLLSLFLGQRRPAFQCFKQLREGRSEEAFLRVMADCRLKTLKVLGHPHRPWFYNNIPIEDPGTLICNCKPHCPSRSPIQNWQPQTNLCTCYDLCYFDHECALVTLGDCSIRRG